MVVSAALPAKVVPIDPPYIELLEDIPFNLYPGAVNYVDMSAVQQKLIETLCMPNELLDRLPLDSRREPWHDPNAGVVPVVE